MKRKNSLLVIDFLDELSLRYLIVETRQTSRISPTMLYFSQVPFNHPLAHSLTPTSRLGYDMEEHQS